MSMFDVKLQVVSMKRSANTLQKLERLIKTLNYKENDRVPISGAYGDIRIQFNISVYGDGVIQMEYQIFNLPIPSNINTLFVGKGFEEVDIAYLLSSKIDKVTWNWNGLWSSYTKHNIDWLKGIAKWDQSDENEVYRQKPVWP